MYNIAVLKFYPNQTNPLHASGRGVWRVNRLLENAGNCSGRSVVVEAGYYPSRVMFVRTTQKVKPRSRVNPRHLLGV